MLQAMLHCIQQAMLHRVQGLLNNISTNVEQCVIGF